MLRVICAPLVLFSLVAGFVCHASAQTLRQEADRIGILVGTAVNPAYLSEEAYASTLAREFNMFEPEDAMKWTGLHPDEKTFDFESADLLVGFAQTHNVKVRGLGDGEGFQAQGSSNRRRGISNAHLQS